MNEMIHVTRTDGPEKTRPVHPVFSAVAWLWNTGRGVPGWLAVAGFVGLSGIFFLLFVLMAIYGIPWAKIIYAEAPYQNFFLGLASLFAAWVVHSGWRSPWTTWRRVSGKFILFTLSLAFSFALGEVALRAMLIVNQQRNSLDRLKQLREMGKKLPVRSTHPMAIIIEPSYNARLVYELKPNLDMLFGHRTLRTNSDGMRDDRDYSTEKPQGVIRIFGIGDSGMFGWGVHQNQEYMAVLRSNLQARADGHRYEVMHAAVPGYNTQLEVESLRAKGLKYKPDIVIVGWCDNDFSLPFFMLQKENYYRRDVSFLHLLLFHREQLITMIAGAHFRDMRNFDRNQVVDELLAGSDIQGVENAFRELKGLAETNHFKVLVFGSMRKEAEEICSRVGLPYFNLRTQIPADRHPPEWAVHFMHPRPEGHAVLARYLEQELIRLGWLPAAPAGVENTNRDSAGMASGS
ncbi:MAG: SGNH/GDSL hydrolase family protein [Kiritimatiellae bacterium]|nr:SGNH/GDSL hydrolase family protein [Kiritimatiellia bacterium]MDW8458423.1 SGNH/GDSL hydrolase family protein [Verrucomicrobiota bacterium]